MFHRICEKFTRLLAAWVVLAGVAAYFFPCAFIVCRFGMEWFFALTMLGIGMILDRENFKPLVTQPRLVFLGSLAQFAIMPAAGYLVARVLQLPPELALGVILTGAVPGAMASNVLSYLARADVAYSIGLTTASTFLSPILTPLLTYVFAGTYFHVPFWPMFLSILKMVILPLFLGMWFRHIFRARIEKFAAVFPALSTIFIAFICGLVVALNKDYLAGASLVVFAAVFLHNALGLSLGYGAAVLYRFDTKRRRTLSLEVGMQNAGLGAVLALKHFSDQAALPNALFATWCIVTASILAEIWSRREAGRPSQTAASG
ncbi:MAG: bile acid:sodium symporter family protein [Candidatus Omnitrophica bacterium]|nr:bile acid:sodium symporter family protein [Candidatus Omnitrophota bacterium]MDD5574882.1 bile acid:sodium symporter family protein [Candidatus Omnitrophota bacterium]